ncbi:unnamed protein product [Discosporangium mesarthrocarpum]
MFQGGGGFGSGVGGGGAKGFGQWYADIQRQEAQAVNDLEGDGTPGRGDTPASWRFWQGNEKKTDGATASLLPSFMSGRQTESGDAGSIIMGMTYQQRFNGFVAMLLLSMLFFALAFLVGLPTIILRPSKFALTFTLGSLCFMGSFAMLKGPTKHVLSMCAVDRLPFSVAYLGSMAGTLYACMVMRSYLVVVTLSGVQILALLWYFLSFVPGGSRGMSYFLSAIMKTARYTIKPCMEGCFKSLCFCARRAVSSST